MKSNELKTCDICSASKARTPEECNRLTCAFQAQVEKNVLITMGIIDKE